MKREKVIDSFNKKRNEILRRNRFTSFLNYNKKYWDKLDEKLYDEFKKILVEENCNKHLSIIEEFQNKWNSDIDKIVQRKNLLITLSIPIMASISGFVITLLLTVNEDGASLFQKVLFIFACIVISMMTVFLATDLISMRYKLPFLKDLSKYTDNYKIELLGKTKS